MSLPTPRTQGMGDKRASFIARAQALKPIAQRPPVVTAPARTRWRTASKPIRRTSPRRRMRPRWLVGEAKGLGPVCSRS